MELIIGVIFIGVVGYLLWNANKPKLDINHDGKVDKADAVAAVEKVEAVVVEEAKKVEAVVVEEVKKAKAKVAKVAKKAPAAKKTTKKA